MKRAARGATMLALGLTLVGCGAVQELSLGKIEAAGSPAHSAAHPPNSGAGGAAGHDDHDVEGARDGDGDHHQEGAAGSER